MITIDIAIVGGGIVGQACALALAKQTSLSIAIIEEKNNISSSWHSNEYNHRVSAINLASKRILQQLSIWKNISAKRASAFHGIEVFVANHQIIFDAADIHEHVLGYIVENNLIAEALHHELQKNPRIHLYAPIQLTHISYSDDRINLHASDQIFSTKLAIAADGAHSWLRDAAHISVNKNDYEQHAIVAQIETEYHHADIARQLFYQNNILAFLPLAQERCSSIVWSLDNDEAEYLFNCEEQLFCDTLSKTFACSLGKIIATGKRYRFPLFQLHAKNYISNRIALIGDAAHHVHPLAGQGLNIGLLDAASLSELIASAEKKYDDIGATTLLRRYERWRKADNIPMLRGVHQIKKIYSNQHILFDQTCSFALPIVNHVQQVKNMMMRYAVGNRFNMPSLAKKIG